MSRESCRDVPDPWGCSESLCKKSSCAFIVLYQMVEAVRFGLLKKPPFVRLAKIPDKSPPKNSTRTHEIALFKVRGERTWAIAI